MTGRSPRVRRLRGALLLLLAALLAMGLGAWWSSRPPSPSAFYDPAGPVTAAPGTLLRQEPLARGLPRGAKGWRILYATSRPDGSPAAASAVVILPAGRATAPRPVIAWAHGTTGVARGCAPSMQPVESGPELPVPALPELLAEGWALVATDYTGLGTTGPHLYLVGADEGRAVLDSVRAARALAPLSAETVVWGHSQGGHAALWAGQIAPDYAPELALAGVAAIAPASDLPALVEAQRKGTIGKIISAFIVSGYAAAYPDADVWAEIPAAGRPLVADIARRCLDTHGGPFSALEAQAFPGGIFTRPPAEGALGPLLARNTPSGPFPAPVMIAQGGRDALVQPRLQDRYVRARCAAGQPIDYGFYARDDHLSIVAADSPLLPDLLAWTRARLAGAPVTGPVCQGRRP